ncbi:hypothetical protein QTO12_04195 [Vibrio owensii]|uniref:hypothetical protein n=1 Tax=Vibrio owensii TaxID=696485 RepID=UPI001B825C15|nr:hypothetical protein [Vibrio parahaemolyticus]
MDINSLFDSATSLIDFFQRRPQHAYSLIIGLPIIIVSAIFFSIKKEKLFEEAGLDPQKKAETFKFTPKELDK